MSAVKSDEQLAEERQAARIAEAREELHEDEKGNPVPAAKPDPPVYDERGNVRPRGTKGAKPMTYAERVAIAKRIQDESGDKPAKRARRTARKAAARKTAQPKK